MDLFGSLTRTRILIYIALAEETYPAELARGLNASKLMVQRILSDLEVLGVVASRLRGRVCLVTLNKRWYALAELRALLLRMITSHPDIRGAVESVRKRPRRQGKTI
jgi:DNA-binding transcriptional ArsR family regulator